VAFCPHCGAPQIRVSTVSPPEQAATPAFPPGTPDQVQPPGQPGSLTTGLPGKVYWRQGIRASALAGLLLALAIFLVPVIVAGMGFFFHLGEGVLGLLVFLASWCCMMVGGALAVRFYRRRRPQAGVSTGMGARLGAASGLLGFFFYSIPQALRLVFFHMGGSLREAMQKAMEQSAAQSGDPKAQEMMRNLMSPGALAALLTLLVVLFFLLFLALPSLGGAIGASVWGSKESS
jgi:hypothetical protein